MFYGVFSPQYSENQETLLAQLESVISWNESSKHPISVRGLSGGLLFDSRLPYTADESLYQEESHDLLIVVSGCIYNRTEICEEHALDSNLLTAPALVAKLFSNYGVKFVEYLNGDFTILVYQPQQGTFLLFRDHLGIRPLAYTVVAQSIFFFFRHHWSLPYVSPA